MPMPDVPNSAPARSMPRRRRSPTPPATRPNAPRIGAIVTLRNMDLLDGCQAVIVSKASRQTWRARLLAPAPDLPFTLPPVLFVSHSNVAPPTALEPIAEPITDTRQTTTSPQPLNGIVISPRTLNTRVMGDGQVSAIGPHFSSEESDDESIEHPHPSLGNKSPFIPPPPPRHRPRNHFPTFHELPANMAPSSAPILVGDIVRLRGLKRQHGPNAIGDAAHFNDRLGIVHKLQNSSATVVLAGSPVQRISTATTNLERVELVKLHRGRVCASPAIIPSPAEHNELPPPWGCGHIVNHPLNPSSSTSILFKVDSGCEPYDIISEAALPPGTPTIPFHTTLDLADGLPR